MKKFVASLVFGLVTISSHAADLRAPFDFENTLVLPVGVRNPRFKNLFLYMDERYGGTGGIEPLGHKLNKNVSWRDVVDGQEDDTLKGITEAKLKQLGINLDESTGSTSGVVNTYVNVKVPVLAMGVTEKLTMAVAVPIMSIQVNADTGLIKDSNGQADSLIASLYKSDPDKAREAEQKLNNAVNTKLKRLGYEPITSREETEIGDVRLVGKYQAYNSAADSIAIKGEVTAPTGVAPNADRALDTPTGDGQTDLGAMVVYDHFFDRSRLVRANFYAGYTAQLPDHLERRLPVSDRDSLSADKELLARDLGDVIASGAAFIYEFPFGLNMAAGYGFQRMAPTSFEGVKYAPYRYRLLEANTGQVLHSATFGMGFSSVEMYRNKQFKAPFQVNVAYSKPLAGINVVRNGFMSFELVLFF